MTERNLSEILADVVSWQRETFGFGMDRGEAMAHHLAEEAEELVESAGWLVETASEQGEDVAARLASGRVHLAGELADVLILAAGVAAEFGVDLAAAVEAKLAKNRKRTWLRPDEHGVVRHAAEGA